MQQEVYGEVVQGEIGGVAQPAPVIHTATLVTTQPGFSAEVELGAYKGFSHSQVAPSAPPRVIDSGLVLVRAGSPGVLRFDQFQALQAGMAAPLTCHASNPGNGVGTKYPEERTFGEWRYTESKMVAAQNACMAQLVQGKFIKRVDANLVLDVAFWVFQEGTAVNWVGGGSDGRTYLHGGGRDFRVNSDGSICLVNHPHLCLGVIDFESQAPRSAKKEKERAEALAEAELDVLIKKMAQWMRSRYWRDRLVGPFKEGLLSYAFLAIGFSLLLGPGVSLKARVGLCWVAIPGLMAVVAVAIPGTAIVAFLCFLVGIIVYRCTETAAATETAATETAAATDTRADAVAEVDKANENCQTPLYIACQNGHVDTARLLLDNGAEVDKANENGVTPLYIACEKGHIDVARLLLEKGANVDKAKKDGAIEANESTTQVMQNPPPPRHDLLNMYSGEIGICVLLFYFVFLYQHAL